MTDKITGKLRAIFSANIRLAVELFGFIIISYNAIFCRKNADV
jgi:hypothetical protein